MGVPGRRSRWSAAVGQVRPAQGLAVRVLIGQALHQMPGLSAELPSLIADRRFGLRPERTVLGQSDLGSGVLAA